MMYVYIIKHKRYLIYIYIYIRVRVRERLSATPGHVIGQGPAPGGRVVPRGGGGGGGGGESDFPSRKLTFW